MYMKSKYILKKAFANFLPDVVLNRPKMGFGIPVDKWFRNELKDYIKAVLLDKRTIQRGYFQTQVIENMIEQHITGQQNFGSKLWVLLMLELWHRAYMD